MAAPKLNNWNVSYASISFFERAMRGHSKVHSFERIRDIYFKIELKNDQRINVLLVNEYVLGVAAIHRAIEEFGHFDHIVTAGNSNGYTYEAKEYVNLNGFGVFN